MFGSPSLALMNLTGDGQRLLMVLNRLGIVAQGSVNISQITQCCPLTLAVFNLSLDNQGLLTRLKAS
jgi:hypothetical protein